METGFLIIIDLFYYHLYKRFLLYLLYLRDILYSYILFPVIRNNLYI